MFTKFMVSLLICLSASEKVPEDIFLTVRPNRTISGKSCGHINCPVRGKGQKVGPPLHVPADMGVGDLLISVSETEDIASYQLFIAVQMVYYWAPVDM